MQRTRAQMKKSRKLTKVEQNYLDALLNLINETAKSDPNLEKRIERDLERDRKRIAKAKP